MLYSGCSPTLGKRFGTMPSDTCSAKEAITCHATSNRPVTRQRPGNEMNVSRPQSVNQGYPAMTVCCAPRTERYMSAAHQSWPAKESSVGAACRTVSRRDCSRFARAATSSRSMLSLVKAKVLVDPVSSSNVNSPGNHQFSSESSPRCCSTENCMCRYQAGSCRYAPEWKARTGGRSAYPCHITIPLPAWASVERWPFS